MTLTREFQTSETIETLGELLIKPRVRKYIQIPNSINYVSTTLNQEQCKKGEDLRLRAKKYFYMIGLDFSQFEFV